MNRSDFYSEIEEDIPMYKVIVLGCTGSGKTALLTRYQHNFYDDLGVSTLSVDFNIKKRENAWYYYYDTSGQQRYRAIISGYYRGSDACILVYDVTNRNTFNQMSYYSSQIQQNVPDALVYVVGCKGDMSKIIQDEQVTSQYPGIRHVVTSSKLNQGVKELFVEIEQDLLKYKKKQVNQIRKQDIFNDKDIKAINKTHCKSEKKSSCCSK